MVTLYVVEQASPFSPALQLDSPKFEIEHRGALGGRSEIENVSTVSEECSNYTIDLRSCCSFNLPEHREVTIPPAILGCEAASEWTVGLIPSLLGWGILHRTG